MTRFSPRFVTALYSVLALTACMEPARLSPDAPRDNTKKAALIGSVMGAAAGLMSADTSAERRSKVLKGVIIGGGLGLVAGSLLDRQEADLRRDLGNRDVQITNTGEQLIVTLPQDILFATDSTAIRADLQRDLKVLANNLQAYPKSTLTIIGHTDNVGDAGYNLDLSNRRAFSVETVLLDAGTSLGRMNAYGGGEEQPLASNLTAQGRAQNRRVEVVIVSNAG
jgi:outer membrane protein OmpA-like peptidoglycan-associated protein